MSEIFVSLPGMAEITRPIFDLHLLLSPPPSSSGRITFFSQPNKGKPDGLTLLQQNFYIYIYKGMSCNGGRRREGGIRAKVSKTFRGPKSYYSNQFLPTSNTQAV